jgi:hypothetical protein
VAAGLALLVAVVSMVVSWRALDQAQVARDIANAGGGGPAGPAPTSRAEPTDDGGPPATEPAAPLDPAITPGEPELNERTDYRLAYEKKTLRLRANCNRGMLVDLDRPEVGVDQQELAFNGVCPGDPATLTLANGVRGSESPRPSPSPADCNELIITGPIPNDTPIPVRQGVVLCLRTSFTAAQQQGISWKMVVLEIVGVGADSATTVSVTAWDIPD